MRTPAFRVVVPAGLLVFLGAAKEKLDHVALVVGAVGRRAVPQVVVRKGYGSGLNDEGHLTADIGVVRHAIGRCVAKLRARHDDGWAHVGCDIGRIVQAEKAIDERIPVVEAILMPVHMTRMGLFAVPVAMGLNFVLLAQQAAECALDLRVV